MGQPVHFSRIFRFGAYELSADAQELRKFGLRIRLSGQSFQILVILLERAGTVVNREELRQMLWPDEPWGDHDQRLNKAMNRIRDALSDSADTPRYIETIPRVGYRFVFPVAPMHPETVAPAVAPVAALPAEPVPVAEVAPEVVRTRRGRWVASLVLALALVVVVAGGALWYRISRGGPDPTLVPVPLSTFVGAEQQLSFAPDGWQVVFAWEGEQQDNLDLYIGRVGEGGARRLTRAAERDSNPAWSPDGQWIAFRRQVDDSRSEIRVLKPDGSGERRITVTAGPDVLQDPLCWTPDSKNLVFADSAQGSEAALYSAGVTTGDRRRLSSPPARAHGDLSPAISPDGRILAFTRDTTRQGRDIFMVDLSLPEVRFASTPVAITKLKKKVDTLAWTADGRELVFAAAVPAGGLNYLYRMSWTDRKVRDIGSVRLQGSYPAISRDGRTLAYTQRTIEQTSIWRIDVPRENGDARRTRLISSTSRDYSPDIAPDGKRVVMSSIRSGGPQLWIFNVDGSDPRQLTSLGADGASIPRWSPDGTRVVFDTHPDAETRLCTIDVSTGKTTLVETGTGAATRASWTRDGRSLYFASTESGEWQIYQVPASGGTARPLTANGGSYAVEDFDGRRIFYTSTMNAGGTIRKRELASGEEVDLVKNVLGASALALGKGRLYYLTAPQNGKGHELFSYDLSTTQIRWLLTFDRPVHRALTIDPEGKFLVVTQVDRQDTDLMIVPQFR